MTGLPCILPWFVRPSISITGRVRWLVCLLVYKVNKITRPFINHCSERANWARSSKFERAWQRNSGPSKIYFARFLNGFIYFIELPYNLNKARENIQVIISVSNQSNMEEKSWMPTGPIGLEVGLGMRLGMVLGLGLGIWLDGARWWLEFMYRNLNLLVWK